MSKDELMKWFYEMLFSCYPVKHIEYPDSILWIYDENFIRKFKISKVSNKIIKIPKTIKGCILFETKITDNYLYCDYNKIWLFIADNYNRNIDVPYNDYIVIEYIVKGFLNEYSDIIENNINSSYFLLLNDKNRFLSYTPKATLLFHSKMNNSKKYITPYLDETLNLNLNNIKL